MEVLEDCWGDGQEKKYEPLAYAELHEQRLVGIFQED